MDKILNSKWYFSLHSEWRKLWGEKRGLVVARTDNVIVFGEYLKEKLARHIIKVHNNFLTERKASL